MSIALSLSLVLQALLICCALSVVCAQDNQSYTPVSSIEDGAGCIYNTYQLLGGSGGSPWTDFSTISGSACATAYPINLQGSSGSYLNQIQVTYTSGNGDTHGLTVGSNPYNEDVRGLLINRVVVHYGGYIDHVYFYFNNGLEFDAGGSNGANTWDKTFGVNEYVAYFAGRAGGFIDGIQIITFQNSSS